jgi:hypothetical protein
MRQVKRGREEHEMAGEITRAELGALAIRYGTLDGLSEPHDEDGSGIVDAIANVLHYATSVGLDVDQISAAIGKARDHWHVEYDRAGGGGTVKRTKWAHVAWTVEDVRDVLALDEEGARTFLDKYASTIEDLMVTRGWDAINELRFEDGIEARDHAEEDDLDDDRPAPGPDGHGNCARCHAPERDCLCE